MRAFVFLVFLFPTVLFAQPFQGQTFLGGSLDLRIRSSDSGFKRTTFSIKPVMGKMVSDRFAVGIGLGVGSDVSKRQRSSFNPLTGESIITTDVEFDVNLELTPFVSWYFPIKDKWRFRLLTGLGAKASSIKQDFTVISTHNEYVLSAHISPAIYYFVSDEIAFNASFGGFQYAYFIDSRRGGDFSDLELSLSSRLLLGVQFFFGERAEGD